MRGYKTIWINNTKSDQTYKIEIAKNQKIIQIHRIKNGINFEANDKAMEVLSANTYVLYMYLLKHSQNRVWALSNKDVLNKTHLTEKTYPKAVEELILTGYLIEHSIDIGNGESYKENAYYLLEDPSMELRTSC